MDDRIARLIADYFPLSENELHIGEVPVSSIVSEYGTPVFVYDSHVLNLKWKLLRQTYPSRFSICYSVKANPNRTILEFFVARGCGLEVASAGELHLALAAGCPPEQIVFAGPGKTEMELELALTSGIGEIHVESSLEASRVASISSRLGLCARIALRVNPSGHVQGGAMRMGGKPLPFGIDEENLDPVLKQVTEAPALEFRGIHIFAGTQILDYTVLLDQYDAGVEIARRVSSFIGRPLQTIDFGGGLGIRYFANETDLAMEPLRQGLEIMIQKITGESCFAGTEFLIEPGRYLVGDAGIYITRITDIKTSRGKKFLIVDGGMNHHLAASGNLGQAIKRNFPVVLLNRLDSAPLETVEVVGPLCTPLDVLARSVTLPLAEVGDLVGVLQSGAYGRTASPLGFLSHPPPPEVWLDRGSHRLIRRRGTHHDLFQDLL
jgi:diaminopimelate decarboxylase